MTGEFAAGVLHKKSTFVIANNSNSPLIWRSTDKGLTWQPAAPTITTAVTAFATDSTNIFLTRVGFGVYRSTDDGVTWSLASNGLPTSPTLTAVCATPQKIHCGISGKGVYSSTNGGGSWTHTDSTITVDIISMAVRGDTLFAGTVDGHVFRSTDGGTSFQDKTPPEFGGGSQVTALLITDSLLLAGTGNAIDFNGIRASTDRGETWSDFNAGMWKSADGYILIRRIILSDTTLYATCEAYDFPRGMYRRGLHQSSWTRMASDQMKSYAPPQTSTDYYYAPYGILALGPVLVIGTYDNGMYRSADGGTTWTQIAATAGHLGHCDAMLSFGDTLLVAGDLTGVNISTDNGESWHTQSTNLNLGVNALAVVDTVMLTGGSVYRGAYRSLDRGKTWVASGNFPNSERVHAFAVSGQTVWAGVPLGVYISSDYGATWTVTGRTTEAKALLHTGTALLASGNGTVDRSTDGGATWKQTVGFPVNWNGISFSRTGSTLYLGGGPNVSIYQSTDDGISWTALASYPTPPVYALATGGDTIYANSSGGLNAGNSVSYSADHGTTWSRFANTGLPANTPRFGVMLVHRGYLYAGYSAWGTPAVGAWRRKLPGAISGLPEPKGDRPGEFALRQNYPNPFNPRTTVSCRLTAPARVRLTVHDLLGRETAILYDGRLDAGVHEFAFDASRFASGVYFCRLTAPEGSRTIKMQYLK
jgi:hypothetical protein